MPPPSKPRSQAVILRGSSISLARRAAATAKKRREQARAELQRQGVHHTTVDEALEDIVGASASTRANVSQTKVRRQKRIKWSDDEVLALRAGVRKYGEGRWAVILREFANNFHPVRISVDLKDKWRNMFKADRGLSISHPTSHPTSRENPIVYHSFPAPLPLPLVAPVQATPPLPNLPVHSMRTAIQVQHHMQIDHHPLIGPMPASPLPIPSHALPPPHILPSLPLPLPHVHTHHIVHPSMSQPLVHAHAAHLQPNVQPQVHHPPHLQPTIHQNHQNHHHVDRQVLPAPLPTVPVQQHADPMQMHAHHPDPLPPPPHQILHTQPLMSGEQPYQSDPHLPPLISTATSTPMLRPHIAPHAELMPEPLRTPPISTMSTTAAPSMDPASALSHVDALRATQGAMEHMYDGMDQSQEFTVHVPNQISHPTHSAHPPTQHTHITHAPENALVTTGDTRPNTLDIDVQTHSEPLHSEQTSPRVPLSSQERFAAAEVEAAANGQVEHSESVSNDTSQMDGSSNGEPSGGQRLEIRHEQKDAGAEPAQALIEALAQVSQLHAQSPAARDMMYAQGMVHGNGRGREGSLARDDGDLEKREELEKKGEGHGTIKMDRLVQG